MFGDLLFVTERDNHRVQVFELPDFTPLAAFGAGELRFHAGCGCTRSARANWRCWSPTASWRTSRSACSPALSQLDQRVRRYRVDRGDDGRLRARYLGAFGDTGPDGALRMVESIAA